jgi:hypothetical protein
VFAANRTTELSMSITLRRSKESSLFKCMSVSSGNRNVRATGGTHLRLPEPAVGRAFRRVG